MPKLVKFDPSRPLVALTFFRLNGQIYRKENAVPYDEGNDRVLRRLYDLHRIGHSDEEGTAVEVRTPREQLQAGNTERRNQEKASELRAAEVLDLPPTEEEQAAIDTLVDGNTHAQLLELADGLEGVNSKMKKAEIALALVRAGHGAA